MRERIVDAERSAVQEVGRQPGAHRQPLRLCLALPSYDPVYSGAALRFKRYLPGFQERGVHVSVYTATPGPAKAAAAGMDHDRWSELPHGTFLPVEEVDGIPVHRMRIPEGGGRRRAAWFARGLVEFCRRTPEAPDVVQLFTPALAAAPWLWRLRRMGISVVATRTMMPSLPPQPLRRGMQVASMRLASRFTTREVVGSGAMLDAFRQVGIRGEVEVIPHGVDIERFRPPTGPEEVQAVRRSLGLPADASVLLFVGAVSPRKGVHRLLEAWGHLASAHPDLHLVVAGPRLDRTTPEHAAFHSKLEGLAVASGAADRLHLPGVVRNVEEYMRVTDIFVFPSEREGMPNVLGEAMASGLPVVTCPFSGLSSEFGEAGTHYVLSEFDSVRFAGDVDELLKAPRQREELGRSARGWAEAHLDVERSIDRYVEVYSHLAAGSKKRHLGW
jgi:glycosyltransferase involved in cell wall biosynthesis